MKKCNNCNNLEADSASKCSICGNNEFTFQHELLDEEVYDAQKRRKKKMLSMLGILSLIFIALIFITAIKISNSNKKDKLSYNDNNKYLSYSNGVYSDKTYYNEWADIKFVMTEDWNKASNEMYDTYADETTNCIFYAKNMDNGLIAFLTSDLKKNKLDSYSEEYFLKEMTIGIKSKMSETIDTDVSYEMLGNQLYMFIDTIGKIDEKAVCITTYIRFIDQYAIVINITDDSPKKTHAIADMIEPY